MDDVTPEQIMKIVIKSWVGENEKRIREKKFLGKCKVEEIS